MLRLAAGFCVTAIAALIAMGAFAPGAFAQNPLAGRTINVTANLVSPFVMRADDKLTGFSVDLLAAVAAEGGFATNVTQVGTLAELLGAVTGNTTDFSMGAISITSKRAAQFDFSQPMFDAGLQVMVRSDAAGGGFSALALLKTMGSKEVLNLLGFLAALVVVIAHVVWFFDRWHHDAPNYYPDIFRTLYWATGAAGGQQPYAPHSAIARSIGAMSVFASTIIVAYFTATITTSLTVAQLKSEINGPEDLPGKKVATVAGSTSSFYLKGKGVTTIELPKVADAIEALLNKQADAFVYDAPILLYYAANAGKGRVAIVGPIFNREAYGLAFPAGSQLRKPVDEALLRLRESGAYDALYKKWFGDASSGG